MASEVFKLKSLYMDDTIVRGARVSIKNARSTKTVQTNPGDPAQVKTGETGINAEYIVQASLRANDLKGLGTFTNNSDVIKGYTGPADIKNSDVVRLDSDTAFYTVTGIQGTNIYLTEKYAKKDTSTPDVQTGPCTIRKVKLDSVAYESLKNPAGSNYIYYDRDNSSWGLTGMQPSGPAVATTAVISFETGMTIQFLPGSSKKNPDLMTVGSVYKTVVNNNSSPVSDISLSPLPYPHESLQVYVGASDGKLTKKIENEDYVINYSQNPEFKYPRPAYEDRQGAYIKFLDRLSDETQVASVDTTFEGYMPIVKKIPQTGGAVLSRPVSDIIPTESFSVKVGGVEKETNFECIPNYAAGTVAFVRHKNSEGLIESISYPKDLIWDGLSVIKGVLEDKVQNMSNLVIPGMSGLAGITGMVYYEDTDSNNLVRDIDYTIDPESGAISLTNPLKATESVLVSYYVEGEDVSSEPVALNDMRVNKYPVISGSLLISEKYKIQEENKEVTKTKILLEGQDYVFSYTTGRITLLGTSGEVEVLSLEASYTPMAQVNCILQPMPGKNLLYRMTIVDDILKVDDTEKLVFGVSNPVVSIPKKKIFKDEVTNSNYTFSGTILANSLLSVKNGDGSKIYNVTGYKYSDAGKQITLDPPSNDKRPDTEETIIGTYSFESELLPYAPALVVIVVLNQGDSSFVIEGFDRTDVLKKGMILRVDNFDPERTYYFKLKNVYYTNNSTVVELYEEIPEDIVKPTFFLFDDGISWQDLPTGSIADTTIPVLSDFIIIHYNPSQVRRSIKKDTLLTVNGQQVYIVTSLTTSGTDSIVGIFPSLRNTITGKVQYSRLPVNSQGDTALSAQHPILLDPTQPAFTISYQAPLGYEGGAKILVDKERVVITESIAGIKNPVPYVFKIADYSDLYSLAKAIQGTASTYPKNVPGTKVPDYIPFTIFPSGNTKEDYYLGSGSWSADLIVPFENDTSEDLPYTFQITPELFKWSLLQASQNESSFTIKHADKTSFFSKGNLLAFRSKIDGSLYFFEVSSTKLVADAVEHSVSNTVVSLTDTFRLNLLNPTVYKYDSVSWVVLDNRITTIDPTNSEVIFQGAPAGNLRKGTLLKMEDKSVYQVAEVTKYPDNFKVKLVPNIINKKEIYYGHVKQSTVPVYLDDVGPQPLLTIQYSAPVGHTGSARVKIDAYGITLEETVDNFNKKTETLLFKDFKDIPSLVATINLVESYVPSDSPYTASIPADFVPILTGDSFKSYRLETTANVWYSAPYVSWIAVSSFKVEYTTPSGYLGSAKITVLSNEIVLEEKILAYHSGQDAVKEVRIVYSSTKDLMDLAQNVIPSVPSLVSSGMFPYSCTLFNTELFERGVWESTHIVPIPEVIKDAPVVVYGKVDGVYWYALGPLNERRLVVEKDYEIEMGSVTLTDALNPLDRLRLSYMGLWDLAENEGSPITCSCRYFTTLPAGSRVDVYMDYLNIDQFYLQKLTERKFSEIVVVPQLQDLLDQKGSSGGLGSDSGATNNSVQNYDGGMSDLYYALRDEQIKKQLYLRFYEWYKERLRNFSAELQLIMGFKFGHSNALGTGTNGQYTLENAYVENDDYTLTSDEDLGQLDNDFSKFFPIGYDGTAPKPYDRFGTEYKAYNEVYCCNIQYKDGDKIVTVGIVKSETPYWNTGLDFKVWSDSYIKKNLIGNYEVDVPPSDRTINESTYSFLRRIEVGDKIKIDDFKNYYEISGFSGAQGVSGVQDYEYLILKNKIIEKGVKTYILDDQNPSKELKTKSGKKIGYKTLVDNLPPDGFNMYVRRNSKEDFPMFDDYGNLGATAYGKPIEGHVRNTRRIKKPFFKSLLQLLFPLSSEILEKEKNFKIWAKKDSEGDWEDLGSIDLKKLTFKEERNVDDVLDSLRFDFTKKFPVPPIYDIEEDSDKGFHRYFYMSFERVYDADISKGYYEAFVLRSKNREWWFKVTNGEGDPIVDDYGFPVDSEYRNFYDPDNIYKKLLLEKQAWETEELILKDLYDHNDKIARAFDQGNLNNLNSRYQGYLSRPDVATYLETNFAVNLTNNYLGVSIDIPIGTSVMVRSSGFLPKPLKNDTLYYVINKSSSRIQLAETIDDAENNAPIVIEDLGTGVHSAIQVVPDGVANILGYRIPTYERQLAFLMNTTGPVYQLLYPDSVHAEDSASPAISTTFDQTQTAWSTYSGAYQKMLFFYGLNNNNIVTWKNDYVRWVLSLEQGYIYQKDARRMYDQDAGTLTVAMEKLPAINLMPLVNNDYTVESPVVSVSSNSVGKYIHIIFNLVKKSEPFTRIDGVSKTFYLFTVDKLSAVTYKTIAEVCIEINSYMYSGVALFSCTSVFEYSENNVLQRMLLVSGVSIPDTGTILQVTTVADHSSSDPRVLFLDRNMEDRLYTNNFRELPGISLQYSGDYYTQSLDDPSLEVRAQIYGSDGFQSLSYGVFIGTDGHKYLDITGGKYSYSMGIPGQGLGDRDQGEVEKRYSFPFYSTSAGDYISLQSLIDNINNYTVGGVKLFSAVLRYAKDPYGNLSSGYMSISQNSINATQGGGFFVCPLYVHVNTGLDNIPTDINQGVYRVYHDTDFTKKLEIKFNQVVVNGSAIESDATKTSQVFPFNLQEIDNPGKPFKTLTAIANEISSFRYKNQQIFSAKSVYSKNPGGELSTEYVVADNRDIFLGFDKFANIFVDTYRTVTDQYSKSSRDAINAQSAYFSFPRYTANNNPNKIPIEGIPVSGRWDTTRNEPVIELECIDGSSWTITFSDYVSGDFKEYRPPQAVMDKIDSKDNTITQTEYNTIRAAQEQPTVGILKKLILKTEGSDALEINLRQHSTIKDLVEAVNKSRFSVDGHVDPNGARQLFNATLVGDPDKQGGYRSYELFAVYVPIIRDFNVQGVGYKSNQPIGWEIATINLTRSQKQILKMGDKRYSMGNSYKFFMNPPDVAYTDTLNNISQGLRRDILAFDIYCWDIDGYYEVKDNWIYFRSASVGYSEQADLGQPDKTIGYGIPLAGSGHRYALPNESVGSLVDRINNNGVVKPYFYASLVFTRDDSKNPGFFEYGYLPNFSAKVPKSELDNVYLKDDPVLAIGPGNEYSFPSSSYTVDGVSQTLSLSCDWQYAYTFSNRYEFNLAQYGTIGNLASAINSDGIAHLPSSVFEAQVVGSHGSDASMNLIPKSGQVVESDFSFSTTHVSEICTVTIGTTRVNVARGDWAINDPVRFSTTGTLPNPLNTATTYYVVGITGTAPNVWLAVSGSIGGPAITYISLGTGRHTVQRYYLDILSNGVDWAINDVVRFSNSGGSLPTPLTGGTDYYVVKGTRTGSGTVLKVSSTFSGTPIAIASSGSGTQTIHRRFVNLSAAGPTTALQIRVRNLSGAGFSISGTFFEIPSTGNRLVLRCIITYNNSFSVPGIDISGMTIKDLATHISNLRDYPEDMFKPVFSSSPVNDMYDYIEANRLTAATGSIGIGVALPARLNDILAMRLLNMSPQANITITDTNFSAASNSTYSPYTTSLATNRDLYTWIDKTIRGDYQTGLISLYILPIRVEGVDYGLPVVMSQTQLHPDNTPAHVYFGALGDIIWVQISDQNLHTQLNYVKERLGKPWSGDEDFYTPQSYNVNNPLAIDMNNFLGYLKTTRYNQIKNSIINEAVTQNNYFWLYMKFHREFGCDQKVKALTKQITQQQSDSDIISTVG